MSIPRFPSAAGALVAAVALALPASASARTCNIQREWTTFGVTYVTSLKVFNTSCARGKRVVRAYNRCRRANGGVKGRCTSRVLGFRCRERRTYASHQFSSKATCRSGTRRVIFTYTQNT